MATLAVLVMVSAGDQDGDGGACRRRGGAGGGQLFPGVAEVTVLVRVLSPVSGLSTVTEKVIVADWPGSRSPVQVRSGLVKVTAGGGGGVVVVGRVVEDAGQRTVTVTPV